MGLPGATSSGARAWSVRGTLVPSADGFDLEWADWEMRHVHGQKQTTDYTRLVSNVNAIRERMRLDMLRDADPADGSLPPTEAAGPEGLEVVGMILLHDIS